MIYLYCMKVEAQLVMKRKRFLHFGKCLLSSTMAFLVFFASIGNVFASTLNINSVASKFSNTTIIDSLNQSNITLKVNAIDSTLDVYVGEEKNKSFSYTTDYIEYNNRGAVVTQENCTEDIFTMIWIMGIVESIFSLSGYENMPISEEDFPEDFTNNYDTYGLQIETEHYEFEESNEDGSSSFMRGEFIKYFKISLDTDKIKAAVEKYNENILKNLTPKLEAKDITENSITIYSSIPDYTNINSNHTVYCYIYRSSSKNGVYEKISDVAVNCSDSIGFVDEGLDSNTTYYYKGKIIGPELNDIGSGFSDPILVSTKSIANTNSEIKDINGNSVENPQTGSSYPIVGTIITGAIAIVILIYAKRKSVYYKI